MLKGFCYFSGINSTFVLRKESIKCSRLQQGKEVIYKPTLYAYKSLSYFMYTLCILINYSGSYCDDSLTFNLKTELLESPFFHIYANKSCAFTS